jgi:tetratricopeptide (TPR) repeat protein
VQTYLALAEQAEPFLLWREPDRQIWRQRLEDEINHFRAALEFGLNDAPDLTLRLAAALGRFWYLQAQWSEGRNWLERALEQDPAGQDRSARARALLVLGAILKGQSDFASATERLTESLSIFRALDDRWQVAWVLFHLTQINTLTHAGLDEAVSCAHESLSLFQSMSDRWGAALALGQLGSLSLEQKQYAQAVTYLKESLGIQRDLGDLGAVAGNLNLLGTIARIQGDVAQAQAYFMESLPIFEHLDSKEGLAWTHYKLGIVAVECKDHDGAITHLHEYFVLSQELGYKLGVITALEGMARAVALSGQSAQFALAARLLGAAAIVREAVHMPLIATDPTAVDPGIATAKATLGEPAWRAEWSIGRSLPMDQIVAEALMPLTALRLADVHPAPSAARG